MRNRGYVKEKDFLRYFLNEHRDYLMEKDNKRRRQLKENKS